MRGTHRDESTLRGQARNATAGWTLDIRGSLPMTFNAPSFFAGIGTVVVLLVAGFGGGVLMSTMMTGDSSREPNKIERRAAESAKPPTVASDPVPVVEDRKAEPVVQAAAVPPAAPQNAVPPAAPQNAIPPAPQNAAPPAPQSPSPQAND